MLAEEQKKRVLNLARESIETYLENKKPVFHEKFLSEKQGVFVTIKIADQLRGCIGFPEPVYALGKAIIEAARASAFSDPRFPPLGKSELKDARIEVSVLTKPKEIRADEPEDYVKKIKVGEDGLIVRGRGRDGLLLPQVAAELGWDAKEFLQQTCIKAGLPADAWKDPDTKIFKFQADILSEE
jgi:hypothetical protein